ncbi:MAG: hypothetical protein GX937_02280 [Lentisphaerae bacterium]|mgnify:CR=1 FL=1|jgi:hypothetical protein|nr:hypothetical protein [Lentisphaerota bacterium]
MSIIGQATITTTTASALRSGLVFSFTELAGLRDQIISRPECPACDLSDFRRAGPNVKRTILAAILAAIDCGTQWQPDATALLGWNGDGCAAENALFWQDYVTNGRTQGRGTLFVPTLCSIPLCEAAIALGIHGAAAYLHGPDLAEAIAARHAPFVMTITIADSQTTATVLETPHEA